MVEPVPSHGVRDLEALHAIAPFGLLVDHIQNEVDRVGTLGVVTLLPTPVCPKTKLSARKVLPTGPARTESMVPGSRSIRLAGARRRT